MAVVVLAAVLAATTWGRVFQRVGGSRLARLSPGSLGWDEAYRSAWLINARDTDVVVMRSDRSLRETVRRLEAVCDQVGAHAAFGHGDEMGWGLARVDDYVVRFLVFPVAGRGYPLVMRVIKSGAAREHARATRSRLPAYPGSTPTYSASDPAKDLEMSVARAHAPVGDVTAYLASTLISEGWVPALPGPGMEPPQGTVFYLKGNDLCCVSVKSTGDPGESMITLVRRGLGFTAGS
jgi:hypothetical protein